ncbi:MAG: glutamine synthetase III [Firmicutes bacterium]|nr:glutamine synthetase III [Bacillota bacterium]
MKDIPALFGSMVYGDGAMQETLPEDIYRALKRTMAQGTHLELDVANAVAEAMKNWAVSKGATHYTHWFQPLTGVTAEKHESFISPAPGGKVLMEFSGKELVRGESDASSFPSGGIRATFEARGYTVWDTSSYAFIKDGTLTIPTAFCAYSGESLDKKTPLLRSMDAINRQALRILRLFGNSSAKRVVTTVGPEQEYFLVDKAMVERRPDLITTGRTLFGARPPKGQELEDHYFGAIKPRVAAFMRELDEELWKLGVTAKTEHNETAPAQHEMAPIYAGANIATDDNQLTMELMRSIAQKHGMACLLHEKPFKGVNGSGKHNNWSLCTDTGLNLLEPGETPHENAQFLLFLLAVMQAVDEYQDLLRASAASAGNDHRLGGSEAPPAIVSLFLGDELTEVLDALEAGADYHGREKRPMEIGAVVLPHFPKDSTDRNRTSPFAFTGNKFEFRMLGASFSVADANTVLNTAVADVLGGYADKLEHAEDFTAALNTLIRDTIRAHRRILFNGNNYAAEWAAEATRRGLHNFETTVDALPAMVSEKSLALFGRQSVLTAVELRSRCEIQLENYSKTVNIEALSLADLTKQRIVPAVIAYENELAKLLERKSALSGYNLSLEKALLSRLSNLGDLLLTRMDALDAALAGVKPEGDALTHAAYYRDAVLPAMSELRQVIDKLETLVAREFWPVPTYAELLNSVN